MLPSATLNALQALCRRGPYREPINVEISSYSASQGSLSRLFSLATCWHPGRGYPFNVLLAQPSKSANLHGPEPSLINPFPNGSRATREQHSSFLHGQ